MIQPGIPKPIASYAHKPRSSSTTLQPGCPTLTIDQVLAYLRGTPEPVDMVSLNTGNIVFNTPLASGTRRTIAIPNSYEDIRQTILVCRERGIVPEPAVLDTGFLTNVATLVQDGLLSAPRYLLVEFSGRFGDGLQIMPGTARSYFYMTACVHDLFPQAFGSHMVSKIVCSLSRASPLPPARTCELGSRIVQP